MKKIINGIIVVEGKTDVAFLSQFLDAEFVTTNGSEIADKTIEYLQKCSGNRDVFVLTDPDSPGKKIRDKLDQKVPNLKHCFISKENSIKRNKVGIAESTKDEVLRALENYLQTDYSIQGNITHYDLVKLGLEGDDDSSNKRKIVCDAFHLGHCNGKTFLKRLNFAKLSLDDIMKVL